MMSISNTRSKLARQNIILSFFNKGIAVIVSFIFVSATVDYLNPVNYGIWITLTSIVTWAGNFDFGLHHGFRNHLTRALSNEDNYQAKQLVSTSYVIIFIIFLLIFLIFYSINTFFDWSRFLNLDISNNILKDTFSVLVGFFSIQSVLNLIQIVLTSDQRPAYASLIYTFGQICALVGIYVLMYSQSKGNGSLIDLAWIIGGIPIIVYICFSIILYSSRYKSISPSVKFFNKNLIKKIVGLGSKFFLIQLSMLLIFQCTNLIITKNLGPDSATVFNVSYKYMGIVYMCGIMILTPFWSAFTDAYEKRDFNWMNVTYKKLKKLWMLSIPAILILIIVSKFVYSIWLNGKVEVPLDITIYMGIYALCMTRGTLYMFLINGIGKVFLQMIIYVSFAIFSIPIMYIFSLHYGLEAIILFSSFVYLVQAVIGEIQLKKLLSQEDNGIWGR